mgnify:CR=1 FL=1
MSTHTNTIEQLRWELTGATKPCQACHWAEGYFVAQEGSICKSCSGTGKVFVLPDAVRVPCNAVAKGYRHLHRHPCDECYGLNYMPSTDLAVWLKALFTLEWHVTDWFDDSIGLQHDDPQADLTALGEGEPEEALLGALKQVLKYQGYTMGEVP